MKSELVWAMPMALHSPWVQQSVYLLAVESKYYRYARIKGMLDVSKMIQRMIYATYNSTNSIVELTCIQCRKSKDKN